MRTPKPITKPPGSGLPPIEAFVARHILMPFQIRKIKRDDAVQILIKTGQEALNIIQNLPADKASQPTLVTPIRGLEDSSRNWSIIMTVEHLLITGTGMQDITQQLSQGIIPKDIVRVETVKPRPGQSPDNTLTDYQNFLDQYENTITSLGDLHNEDFKHEHPWFGALTAHDWLALNAAHHRIHMNQIQAILRRL